MTAGPAIIRWLIGVVTLVVSAALGGCDAPVGDYLAASSISRSGFAKHDVGRAVADGQDIRLWGFVDHGNVRTDRCAIDARDGSVNGVEPAATTWQFNLKASERDRAGASFAVCVPMDDGAEQLQRMFLADASAGRPTRVFVTGRIFTFDAPTNYRRRTGLYMRLRSSGDVLLAPPAPVAP